MIETVPIPAASGGGGRESAAGVPAPAVQGSCQKNAIVCLAISKSTHLRCANPYTLDPKWPTAIQQDCNTHRQRENLYYANRSFSLKEQCDRLVFESVRHE